MRKKDIVRGEEHCEEKRHCEGRGAGEEHCESCDKKSRI